MISEPTIEKPEQRILSYAIRKNVMFKNAAAIQLLASRENAESLIDEFVAENTFLLDEEKVREKLLKKETKLGEIDSKIETVVEVLQPSTRIPSKEFDSNYRIMQEYDVTGKSYSEGKIADFLAFFHDKFNFLEGELKKRQGFEPKSISRLSKTPQGREVHFIGMVREKKKTKNGHTLLIVEDLEGECAVLGLKSDGKKSSGAEKALLDDMIGIKGTKGNNDFVIAKEIIFPEMPQRTFKGADTENTIAVISDIHIGSRLFLENEFNQFIQWLNGKHGSEEDRDRARKIKYLFVVGDNVDGVGVYPEQYDELVIRDVYDQYDLLSNYLEQIPEHIETFICPGQHDAVRWGAPQPAVPKEYVPRLTGLNNIHFVGNPSWVEVEGLKTLMYDGASVHQLYSDLQGLDPKKPEQAMIELLKRRDLMTAYGVKQPYVPEKKNFLLIRSLPDLYLGGDMHLVGYGNYRGTIVVNASTWQSQTSYQVKRNIMPTPGIVPTIDLRDGKISETRFLD